MEYEIKLKLPYVIKSKKRHQTNFKTHTHRNPSKQDEEMLLFDITNLLSGDDIKFIDSIKNDKSVNISVSVKNYYRTTDIKKLGRPKVTTPDVDNFLKLFMDSVNEVLWSDDRQVYKASASKWWASESESTVTIKYFK